VGTTPTTGGQLLLLRPDHKEGTFLFNQPAGLEKLTLAKVKPVVIKSRDGLDLVSYLTLPAGVEP